MNKYEQLEEELKQVKLAYQMAAQMSEFKASFLARTSHELRSPLSSLIGIHQLILSDLCENPQEEKEFIEQAYQSALKLMKLIDEIVAVSKIEHGSTSLCFETLQLTKIFHCVRQLTYLQAANRNLKLTVTEPDPILYVLADRARLIQLVANLIDSGISLMDGGEIEVTTASNVPNFVDIHIDLQCSANLWLDSKETTNNCSDRNLLKEIDTNGSKMKLSPKMKFMLSQSLLETMGGSLKLLDLSSQSSQYLTRLVLSCKKAIDYSN
ncbi:sensor histidine kinase KdpD [Myxosarcina sp. GI1]|uniref:sensor histidine kinase n=1 Tax=Myxosarcina sp. GI1 TaxID=1541065 RepID=UPI00056A7192|nr:HAMP domain-containing sensor histidine kinase [Myxosarcina sp. GI1]